MEPDVNTEHWTNQWRPATVTDDTATDQPRQTKPPTRSRRSGSRRARSESARLMLEMLRALAQSEADTLADLNPSGGAGMEQNVVTPQLPEPKPVRTVKEPATTESREPSGLSLLKASILGAEPEDIQLHCQYCDRMFRLREGGASFDGKAACANCEQHLNRDIVLPAVAKNRPNLCKVSEVAQESEQPQQPKRPAWHRQARQAREPRKDRPVEPVSALKAFLAEDLQKV